MLELKFKEISEDTREAMKESLFDDEDYYSRAISIPMYSALTNEAQDYVIQCIQEFFL